MDFGSMAGGALGGVLGFIGGQQANQKNWDIAQSNNQFSAQQFATRYQTTVDDLKAAGLNPMLAYSQGGGTPPTASSVAPMQNALGQGVDAYNKTKGTSAQSALQAEQAKQSQAQTGLINSQSAKTAAETEVALKQAQLIDEDIQKRKVEQPLIRTQTQTSEELGRAYIQQAGASAAQAAKAYEEIKNISQQNQNLRADLQRMQQANDQSAPESEIAKKYPTFYYIFHKLMPSLSGSIGKPVQFTR
jgi:hypothetical protein